MTHQEWLDFLSHPDIPLFNAKMLESPHDDAVRLVFADWIEENHPDPFFAEAIRKSIALPKKLVDDDDFNPAPIFVACPFPRVSRGVQIQLHRARFAIATEPNANENFSERADPLLQALAQAKWIGYLSERYCRSKLINFLQDPFNPSTQFYSTTVTDSLQYLELYKSTSLKPKDVEILALSTILTNLIYLDLSSNGIGDEGVRALVQSKLNNLNHLDLGSNRIGSEGARALSQSTMLSNLSRLDLNNNEIGTKGAEALAVSTTLKNLNRLNLTNNKIGDEGARALAMSTVLNNLTHLNLTSNGIGNEGAQALAMSTILSNLNHLDLSCNWIGLEGAQALAQSATLPNLTDLRVK